MKKLYVANIPFEVQEAELRDLFESVGKVDKVQMIKDRDTGNPRGFGFVEMATPDLAEEAIRQLNGGVLGSRRIRVEIAQEKPQSQRQEGSRGGRPGGYGGDARRY